MPSPSPIELLNAVENIDPALLGKMREALTPQGTGQVATSQHFTFIVCHILRGASPGEVSAILEMEKKQFIAPVVIRDYTLQFIEPGLIRPNLLFRYLQNNQEPIDETSVLETAVRIQRTRVAAAADNPTPTLEDKENARREIDLLAKLAVASLDAKIKTNRVPTGDQKPTHQSQEVHFHFSGEKIDPRQATNALSAFQKIRTLMAGQANDDPEAGPKN